MMAAKKAKITPKVGATIGVIVLIGATFLIMPKNGVFVASIALPTWVVLMMKLD
jgi:hypothetical protein